jgi:hypothetical protein
VDCVV